MDFYEFCSLTPSQSAGLKQSVDACAQCGRSYEFPHCPMPQGCRPGRADLGFWRWGRDYFLYLRPAVDYDGPDPALVRFFQEGALQRFDSFSALERRLRELGPEPTAEAAPAPDSFHALEEILRSYVAGQDPAVEAAAFKLYGHVSKRDPARPLSLIFYGPTCVGKSELGKAIAPALSSFGVPYRLVWTELNTFTEAHSAYRLTGAPPGYAGYDDPPVLEAVRQDPRTVFMFDELDKAHPEVLKVFMSILDEGRCSAHRVDEQGERELDFRRCVFLFTTNTDLSAPRRRLGFVPPERQKHAAGPSGSAGLAQRLFQADESARRALVSSGVLREIAGRFSGLIGFRPLDPEARRQVTARQIAALGREYGLNIVQTAPELVRALTPADALSLRSSAAVLEGVLTPLLLRHAGERGVPLRLDGSPDSPCLLPVLGPEEASRAVSAPVPCPCPRSGGTDAVHPQSGDRFRQRN